MDGGCQSCKATAVPPYKINSLGMSFSKGHNFNCGLGRISRCNCISISVSAKKELVLSRILHANNPKIEDRNNQPAHDVKLALIFDRQRLAAKIECHPSYLNSSHLTKKYRDARMPNLVNSTRYNDQPIYLNIENALM